MAGFEPTLNPVDRIVGGVHLTFKLVLSLLICAVVVPPMAAAVAVTTLFEAPLPGELPDQRPNLVAVPSLVYDADGAEIGVFRSFDRTVAVTPEEIPEVLKDAIVAIEDQRFWEHPGVDVEGVVRAARINLELGGVEQGGSTITQQYIKNVYLSGERSFERKAREALLATELERRISKEEILFGYLESSYFGSGAYGVGAAAEVYFAKAVSELDISEAATLAGLVQAPTRLSPRVDPEAAEDRRLLVLQQMLDQEYITDEDYSREAARKIWLAEEGVDRPSALVTLIAPPPPKGASAHPFFVDWVEADLLEQLGDDLVYTGGLRIETTIDSQLQAVAEAAVAKRLQNTEFPIEMGMVSLDPKSGYVKAMVGGRDYPSSQVNLAIGGSTGFQPGSSFKPIVLAEAFSRGLGPNTRYNAPGQWRVRGCVGEQCTVQNYDHRNRGRIDLREATRASVNTVFAQLILDVGIPETVATARQLGLERLDPNGQYGASLALGAAETSPLEMASAYGTFANRGVRVAPTGILRVTDADGNVLIDNSGRAGKRVLDEAVADNITNVLLDVVEDGTGKRAKVEDHIIAGKTGTAQAYRAAWFVGYTPEVSTAIWMGHADKLASLRGINGVNNVTGGSHPAIAFSEYMTFALKDKAPQPFPEPAQLQAPAAAAENSVIAASRSRTVARVRDQPRVVQPDCDGPCTQNRVPSPQLITPAITVPPDPNSDPNDPGADDPNDGDPNDGDPSDGSSTTTQTSTTETPTSQSNDGGGDSNSQSSDQDAQEP